MANLIGVKNTGDILTAGEINSISQMITAPAAPVIARAGGVTGTPTLTVATVTVRTPDSVGYYLEYDVTTGAAGAMQVTITPPALWTIQMQSPGAYLTASSLPQPVASLPNGFLVQFGSAAAHKITAFVLLVKN